MRGKQHYLIFVAMAAGAGIGLWIGGENGVKPDANMFVWFSELFGKTIFIGALKAIVAPLIFFSIIASIVCLPTTGELWQIGWRTLVFYLVTTSIAVGIGLLLVLTIQPGMRGDRDGLRARWPEMKKELSTEYAEKESKLKGGKSAGEIIRQNITRIIQNPFEALSTRNSLGIIFFAILIGIALIAIGEAGRPVIPVVQGINAAIMRLTGWIMAGAPFFIFCLVAALTARYGTSLFATVGWYVATIIAAIGCHVVVLLVIVRVFGKRSPFAFLKGIRRAWAVAFATRSSAATLPVTMECVRDELKVPRKIGDFVLPLGATVNMDGTALYEGVAIIFLIQLFGGLPGAEIDLTATTTIVIFLTAVLASIGAAAVPDAGLITMVLVAGAVGLSEEFIPIIFAVDAFLDMFRTSTNVMGDSVGAVVISRLTGSVPGDEDCAGAPAAA